MERQALDERAARFSYTPDGLLEPIKQTRISDFGSSVRRWGSTKIAAVVRSSMLWRPHPEASVGHTPPDSPFRSRLDPCFSGIKPFGHPSE